ncbi:MAG: DUF2064 domain-containing protein [Ilumatobacteraceae bacterium]
MHVTVIAKSPVAGHVKTRLCPPCTPAQAAAIAAAGIADTIDAIDTVPDVEQSRRVLLLEGLRQEWMPAHFDIVMQRGEGLGERLHNGFADLGPGVITGMETPHMAHRIGEALEAVGRGCDVLGLAEDGGYWIIGLSARTIDKLDRVFSGIPMSAADTGLLQLRRLRDLGDEVMMMPTTRDLDTIDDLRAVAASGRTGMLAALARSTIASLPAANTVDSCRRVT